MPKYCVIIDVQDVEYPYDEEKLIDYFKHILKSSPLDLNANKIIVAVSREKLVDKK